MGTKLKAFLQALWTKLKGYALVVWNNAGVFKVVVVVGGVFLTVIKFHQALINLLVSSSKSLYNSTQKESNSLQQQENANNNVANQLVQQAEQLPNSEKPVSDDWNIGK
jgi:hypothetical protein